MTPTRFALTLLLLGCGQKDPARAPDPPPTPTAVPAPPAPEHTPSGDVGAPDGAPCLTSSACASGVCEGVGCREDTPGTCMSRERLCTMDLRLWCDCDGATFQASGSCPGRRVAHKGACDAPETPTP